MLTVAEILRAKGHEVFWVETGTTVLKALELMAAKDIGALLVMNKGEPVGIFSERDFARLVAEKKNADLSVPVDACMTRDVFCVSPNETDDECMALLTNKHFRHLPVRDDEKIVGVISIGDVVKNLIEDKNLLIDNMEKYILGRGYGE
jgi:CBS domain-containing protein